MSHFLSLFAFQFTRALPLFLLIVLGYVLLRSGRFSRAASAAISSFALNFALTSMLFRTMSKAFREGLNTDLLLLVAYFGSAGILFLIGSLVIARMMHLERAEKAIFGVGTVFSNAGLLGLPLAYAMLGEEYITPVATILSVNALTLWTMASIAVELSMQTGAFTLRSLGHSMLAVVKNPLIISIFAGALWGLTKIPMPFAIDEPMRMLGNSATPLCLIAVGMGLAEYGISENFIKGCVLSACKLVLFPGAVFLAATLLGLGQVETVAITFIAGLPVGVNVYLMTRQFNCAQGLVANAMIISTIVSSLTVPLVLTLLQTATGS